MSNRIVVVGSVALDTVETPMGKAANLLGGSATYFSLAASWFVPVQLVAAVGEDFPRQHVQLLKERPIDTTGLAIVRGEKTFRWHGRYHEDLNTRTSLKTELNVFAKFRPRLPASYRSTPVVFLANIDPVLQANVLSQVRRPRLVACDTMDLWIATKRRALLKVLKQMDLLIINDQEARQLAQASSLRQAAQQLRAFGPQVVIIKKGEHGCFMSGHRNEFFFAPGYPLETVVDPTGAGDTFAGGVMGYLASRLSRDWTMATVRHAIVHGSVLASFCVEDFGVNRLRTLAPAALRQRVREFIRMTHIGGE